MNEWARRTLQLVKEENYLDRLQEIYPHEQGERSFDSSIERRIRRNFQSRKYLSLLNQLLDLEKFPYKDSYVAFLRKDRGSLKRNPRTVERISSTLYEMGIDKIIAGVSQPKEANTRRGQQFKNWAKQNFRWATIEEFKRSTKGILMLDASERQARDFCNKVMGVGISKRPDMVAKTSPKYVIGEAKFLSSSGGNQGRAFDDGMNLANNTSGSAYKVFVLDGIHWIETGSNEYKRIEYGNAAVFSALLLGDFLKSIIE